MNFVSFTSLLTILFLAEAQGQRLPCQPYEATCSNGQCISKEGLCDGRRDCADGSDESNCGGGPGCEPNEYQCQNGRCVLKTWVCDSDDDCGDGSDENTCGVNPPGSPCQFKEWMCQSGDQCIPKSFHCDGEVDCQDSSDEIGCTSPKIVESPPARIKINPYESFIINCTAVGIPPPEIVWRLNWGHVPTKCTMTSSPNLETNRAFGEIVCPSATMKDQGAYSCEAINAKGTCFAGSRGCGTPGQDAIVIVRDPNSADPDGEDPSSLVCPPGTFNAGGICVPSRPDGGSGGQGPEYCPPGYYFDNGYCNPCNCPSDSSGRPTSCYKSSDGLVTCNCPAGYQGRRCESCSPGYVSRGQQCIPRSNQPESPPEVSIEPNFLDVNEGDPAEFFCRVNNGGEPKWTKGTYEPISDPRASISGGRLYFDSVSMDQNGNQFYCTASNEAGTGSERAILYVRPSRPDQRPPPSRPDQRPPPSRPDQRPPPGRPDQRPYPGGENNLISQNNPEVFAGQELILSCVPSDPINRVRWSKNGGLPSGADPNQQDLRIPNVQPEDSGTYICSVLDPYTGNTVQQSSIIIVVRPPSGGYPGPSSGGGYPRPSGGSRYPPPSGGSVPPSGGGYPGQTGGGSGRYPPPSGGSVPPSGGGYPGQTGGGSGRYPPYSGSGPSGSVSIYPERQNVESGSQAVINCNVNGVPNPNIQWSKATGEVLRPGPKYSISEGSLTIRDVDMNDRGVYVCTQMPEGQRASVVIDVEQNELPEIEIYPSADQTIVKTGSALFQCRATKGIPTPDITWERIDGYPLPSNVETLPGGVIRFNNVEGNEAGEYKCMATNPKGSATEIVNLKIIEPPTITLSPERSVQKMQGERFKLTCTAKGDPEPTLSLRKIGPRDDSYGSGEPINNVRNIPGGIEYDVDSLSSVHEGAYICKASNEAGDMEEIMQLIVMDQDYGRPDYDPGRYPPDYNQPGGENDGYPDNRPGYDGRYPDSNRPGYDDRYPDNAPESEGRYPGYDGRYPENQPGYDGRYPDNRPGSENDGRYPENRPGYDGRYPENRPGYDGRYPENRPGYDGRYPENRPNYDGRYPDNRPGSENDGRYPENRPGYDGRYPENRPNYDGRYPDNRPGSENDGRYPENRPGYDDRYPENRPENDGRYPDNRPENEGRYPENYPGYDGRYPDNRPDANPNYDPSEGTASQSRIDAQVGESIPIPCENPNNLNVESHIWARSDYKPLPIGSYTDDQGTLYLTNVQEDDMGEYVCQGFDAYNRPLLTSNTYLNVGGGEEGPSVVLTPDYQVVNVGDEAIINCTSPNDPNARLEWTKEGDELAPNAEVYPSGILTFRNIAPENEGRYVCMAENYQGQSQGTAQIDVEGDKVTISWLESVLYNEDGSEGSSLSYHNLPEDPNSNQELNYDRRGYRLGDTFEIDCRLRRESNDDVPEWTKDNGEPLREKIQRFGRVIRVPQAQLEDAGLYTCSLNGQTLSFMIDILEDGDSNGTTPPPYEAEQPLDQGEELPLDNEEEEYDDSMIEDVFGDEDCPSDSFFQCENNGGCIDLIYKCDGEFDCTDGSDEKGCDETSNLSIISNYDFVSPGESFEFECVDELNRNEDPQWTKEDGFFETNVFQEGHKLKFLNYDPANDGFYTCSIGEDKTTYEFAG